MSTEITAIEFAQKDQVLLGTHSSIFQWDFNQNKRKFLSGVTLV
jgi:hypothetical protein